MPLKKLKKQTVEKPAAIQQIDERINSLLDRVTRVRIETLKPHPKNPRLGDVELIAESLKANGQYRPLVVQKSTRFILAGNHTWLGARRLQWTHVDVVYVEVDEQHALKILLADNKTAEAGTFDDTVLAEVLRGLQTYQGTGYSRDEIDEIVERNREQFDEVSESIRQRQQDEYEAMKADRKKGTFDDVPLGEEDSKSVAYEDDDDLEDDEIVIGSLEKAEDSLKGAFQLKPDLAFSKEDSVGPWQLPRLRPDRLMTWDDLPEKLLAWAGSATKDWPDDEQWWLYNFGIDSTSGMKDPSKMIMSFYAYDQYFENWWFYPDKYVTKMLNTGIKYSVTPDFSMHSPGEESRVLSMWSLYRARWIGRYMQEAGIKVIPNVTWATEDEDFLNKHILPTLPKKMPLLAMQVQTLEEKNEKHKDYVRQLQHIIDTLQPEALLLYHGAVGKRLFDEGEVKFDGNIKWVESRMTILSVQAKKKIKKKTF